MESILKNILYGKHNRLFKQLEDKSKEFLAVYCGNVIIRDNIFSVIKNYGRKREMDIEILRYPFRDEELWAFTFLKKGTIFVCINSELAMDKQIFAAAHELYHIHCFADDEDENIIRNGSILDADTAGDLGKTIEDLEANAFAGLLLMPEQLLTEQISIYGIEREKIELDSILLLMETFALPYKATVLRLWECRFISKEVANALLVISKQQIQDRISLTGKAKRWQLDGRGQETFGSLLENFDYNVNHDRLLSSRKSEDEEYLSMLKEEYKLI